MPKEKMLESIYWDREQGVLSKLSEGEKQVMREIEKEEHEVTIKDGYATFTTDHFSVYTLAEKVAQNPSENENPSDNVNPNENKEDKGPKDESPKTGVMDIINYVLVVTIFAGVGIVALKKQN